MSKIQVAVIAVVGAGLIAVGCGVSSDKACADTAAAQCAQLNACWSGLGVQRDYGTLDQCQARIKQQCLTGLSARNTGTTASSVESCAAAIGAESCADYLNNNLPSECLPQPGHGAAGDACSFSAQCSSAFCAVAPNSLCGTCQPAPVTGASCDTQGCGPGQTCVTSYDGSHVCAVPQAAQASCSKVLPCGAYLSCVGDSTDGGGGTPGTCLPQAQDAGAACDPTRQTGSACDPHANVYCNRYDSCVLGQYANPGDACGVGIDGGVALECAVGDCVKVDAGVHVCVGAVVEGTACNADPTIGPGCVPPARCIYPANDAGLTEGTCQLRDPNQCQ